MQARGGKEGGGGRGGRRLQWSPHLLSVGRFLFPSASSSSSHADTQTIVKSPEGALSLTVANLWALCWAGVGWALSLSTVCDVEDAPRGALGWRWWPRMMRAPAFGSQKGPHKGACWRSAERERWLHTA